MHIKLLLKATLSILVTTCGEYTPPTDPLISKQTTDSTYLDTPQTTTSETEIKVSATDGVILYATLIKKDPITTTNLHKLSIFFADHARNRQCLADILDYGFGNQMKTTDILLVDNRFGSFACNAENSTVKNTAVNERFLQTTNDALIAQRDMSTVINWSSQQGYNDITVSASHILSYPLLNETIVNPRINKIMLFSPLMHLEGYYLTTVIPLVRQPLKIIVNKEFDDYSMLHIQRLFPNPNTHSIHKSNSYASGYDLLSLASTQTHLSSIE